MRKLTWGLMAESALNDAVNVLAIINPRGQTASHIKSHVQREFDKGLDSYVGTGGWYATVYLKPGSDDEWDVMISLMPYSVMRYLEQQGVAKCPSNKSS